MLENETVSAVETGTELKFSDRYPTIRDEIRSGDIFAFGGKGNFSNIIKNVTRSHVSHVGIALVTELTKPDPETGSKTRLQIVESTSLDGFSGVSVGQVSKRLQAYDGEIWWLPLGGKAREAVDAKPDDFARYCLGQVGKPYDMSQAVKAGVDLLDEIGLGRNKEDFSKFFCSELAAAALEEVGAFGEIEINYSEVTPIDLCMFKIYRGNEPAQIKGIERPIRGYNSLPIPNRWGF